MATVQHCENTPIASCIRVLPRSQELRDRRKAINAGYIYACDCEMDIFAGITFAVMLRKILTASNFVSVEEQMDRNSFVSSYIYLGRAWKDELRTSFGIQCQ